MPTYYVTFWRITENLRATATSDVKRGQNVEAKAEAEAKTLRPRPEPRGRGRDQVFQAEVKAGHM